MKSVNIIFLFLLAVICCGCNDDIFVEDYGREQDTFVTIDGDGGEATVKMPVKHLERITIDHVSEYQPFRYFNRAGEELPEGGPASEVARIVCDQASLYFEVLIDGTDFKILSRENYYGRDYDFSIRLEYTYTTRFIEVTILKSQPLEFLGITYDDEIRVDNDAERVTRSETFIVDGDVPYTLQHMPFLRGVYSYELTTNEWLIWHMKFMLPVLDYVDGRWAFVEREVGLNDSYRWSPSNWNVSVPVEIPPHGSIRIQTTLIYSHAVATGHMTFRKPASGRTFVADVVCSAMYPIDYEMTVEDAR